jgi:predicted alpha/beta-hydrolase family hydrolase
MNSQRLKIKVSESLGEVSAEIVEAENPKAIVVLSHGAGAGMDHSFMKNLAMNLSELGITTLRFNLHYMESGKKRPDPPPVAHKVIRAAIEKASMLYPKLTLIVAGKSFGGRMSSQLLSKEKLPQVKAIVFYGFPLHPTNNPGIDRAEHLSEVNLPMLFLQGTKDSLAELSLIRGVVEKLSKATLDLIDNADHSFKVGKKDSIVDLSKKTYNWLQHNKLL